LAGAKPYVFVAPGSGHGQRIEAGMSDDRAHDAMASGRCHTLLFRWMSWNLMYSHLDWQRSSPVIPRDR
jgi:hypothetical protein